MGRIAPRIGRRAVRTDGKNDVQELQGQKKIQSKSYRWPIIRETRSLCREYGRAEIGDQKIGQILSAAPVGDDGIWPCAAVREVLEDVASPEIARGIGVGVYNARGFHGHVNSRLTTRT